MAALLDQGFEQMDVPISRRPVQNASRIALVSSAHAEVVRPVPQRARGAVWSIHVGSYATEAAAHAAAVAARREADSGEIRVEPVTVRHRTMWRAMVVGLTSSDAQDACSAHRRGGCVVLRPDAGQVASR
jgi:succinylarginine dihydrolase